MFKFSVLVCKWHKSHVQCARAWPHSWPLLKISLMRGEGILYPFQIRGVVVSRVPEHWPCALPAAASVTRRVRAYYCWSWSSQTGLTPTQKERRKYVARAQTQPTPQISTSANPLVQQLLEEGLLVDYIIRKRFVSSWPTKQFWESSGTARSKARGQHSGTRDTTMPRKGYPHQAD